MNRFLLLFGLVALHHSQAQIVSTWKQDWQNAWIARGSGMTSQTDYLQNSPSSFTITQGSISSSLSITYSLSGSTVQDTCSLSNSPNKNFDNTTLWSCKTTQIFYNATIDAMVFNDSSSPDIFYTRTGASLPEDLSLGLLGGVWTNPVSVNNQSCGISPPSSSIFLSPISQPYNEYSDDGINYLCYLQSSDDLACEYYSRGGLNLQLNTYDPQILFWSSQGTFIHGQDVGYSPEISLNQITFGVIGSNCEYTYQKLNQTLLPNGTWHQDCQNFATSEPSNYLQNYPSSYQVSVIDNPLGSYMVSTSDSNQTGYVYGGFSQYQYFDSSNWAFTYNSQTNTFVNSQGIFYSLNGSFFDPSVFLGTWTNPQSIDNTSLSCCTPVSMTISNSNHTNGPLVVAITLPANSSQCSQCPLHLSLSFQFYVSNSTQTSQLIWVNSKGAQLSITTTSSGAKQLVVKDWNNQYTFSMTPQALLSYRLRCSLGTMFLITFIGLIFS